MTILPDSALEGPASRSAPRPLAARRIWPWLCLAAILLAFAGTVAALGPASNFGTLQDDAMYFASAKALATGQGYVLPSFPGGLTTLKYPELYPWLLSWIWRFNSSFPGNVTAAIGLSVFFGCWFLVACFLVARRLFGLGPAWALAVTVLCAFNFFTLLLGGSVLSDLPFGALALSAVLASDCSLEAEGSWWWMALAGVLAGLSVGLRTVGVTVVAGIALVALLRRAWREFAVICLVGGAVSLPWVLPVVFRALGPKTASAGLSLGWRQTLAFYTSYVGQWRHFVPNWATQRAVLLKNSFSILLEPGIFLLFPLAGASALLSAGIGSIVAIGSWSGIVLRIRQTGWKAIDAIFLFYLAMVIPWPFPPQRFLVPFLPLLVGGFVFLFRELALSVRNAIRRPGSLAQRAPAAAGALALVALAILVFANCAGFAPENLARLMAGRRSQLAQMRQAYRWIDSHTPSGARFIAYDDVLLYLYTGRQAVRPIASTPAAAYDADPAYARRDAAHLDDVARHVRASYWLVGPGDFDREVGGDRAILSEAESALLAHSSVIYGADSGRIRIYAIRSSENSTSDSRVR